MNNEDIIEYLIHELGHIYEVCNMEKEERQKYKIFLNKETCECVACMLEGGFLKFLYHYDEKIFTSLYMWKKDIVTLIPYLLIKFLFEQYVYINENKITEIDLNRYWENLLLKYMPHQVGNKDYHWLKKFVIDDLPFNSFKYLLGRIVSLLTLGSEEDLKDIYTKYFKFGFKFSNYFEFNRKNINNIDKYVNIC